MRNLRTALLSIALFGLPSPACSLFESQATPNPAPDSPYAPAVEWLRTHIEEQRSIHDLPALSVALVAQGEILWQAGFGFVDESGRNAVTPHTPFRAGSISKLINAVTVMHLVEAGELDLDAPVSDRLAEFEPLNPFNADPISLRHLLCHRAGLVREPPAGHYFDPTPPSQREAVASLNGLPLIHPPGTKTKYSNIGPSVAARVLEERRGQKFPSLVQEVVFDPLGMDHSSFHGQDGGWKDLPPGWMWRYEGHRFHAPRFDFGTLAAANLITTAHDLALFMQWLCRPGKEPGKPPLSPKTLASMWQPQFSQDAPFGLGFVVGQLNGERLIGHNGAVYGFSSEFWCLPDRKLGVVLLANLDMANEPLRRLSRGALQALLAAEDGTSLPPWPQRLDPPAALALSMTGRYGQGLDGFELEYQNGRLYAWPFAGGHRMRLRMEGERLVSDGLLHSGQSWRWRNENGQVSLQSGTESDPKLWPRQAEEAPPPRLPPRWQDLLGDYGWDHNTLTVLERNGSLFVLIEWFFLYPLTEIGEDDFRFPSWGLYADEGLRFQRDDSGRVQAVLVGPVRFLRRPAAERENQARLSPESLEALRSTLPAATPPTGDRSDPIPDWVDLATLDPTLDLEIRYAGNQNPLGTAVYPQAKAFLQKQAAEALARVHQRLRPLGYGLLVLDAYQPWSVTRLIWHATPAEFRSFVAEPKTGSRHNRGMAVDLSLVRLTDGQEVTMPSNYGQYDSAAHPFFPGTTSLQRWHRDLLRRFMEAEGFTVHPNKWWQFDYQGWRDWPLFDQSFDQIRASMAETD